MKNEDGSNKTVVTGRGYAAAICASICIVLLRCGGGDDEKDADAGYDTWTDDGFDSFEDGGVDANDDTDAEEFVGLSWVLIPGGSFTMGCSPSDGECYDAEFPTHTVNIDAFEMTTTEITQEQYEAVMDDNPGGTSTCRTGKCPVCYVFWEDAITFCEASGGRLPTEAEWEYAARGETTTRYHCGDDESCLDDVAWYSNNASGLIHVVGQKEPNAYGLYDMLGNVWEWCSDCWHTDYTDAPPDGSSWDEDCTLTSGEVYRILRGGSFGLGARGLRASNRDADLPSGYISSPPGFRCVRDP